MTDRDYDAIDLIIRFLILAMYVVSGLLIASCLFLAWRFM